MGLIRSNAEIFLEAKKEGVDFTHTATLGRLKWYVTRSELTRLGLRYGVDMSGFKNVLRYGKYADTFFKEALGASSLTIIDHSPYEGANVTHDLNKAIPREMEKKFDVVVDSGTLEHVFNFPVAIANCMKMLKQGGTIFISVPANNYLGHGFYQFSPELFFRIFQKENGFNLKRVMLLKHPYLGAELSSRQKLYEVVDPSSVRQRVSLISSTPVLLLVEAQRTQEKPLFAVCPQQSDYAVLWGTFSEGKNNDSHIKALKGNFKNVAKRILNMLPLRLQNHAWGVYQRIKYSLWNREFFKRI